MSKVHVLGGQTDGSMYSIVVHLATPAGNNSAGFPWPVVIVAAKSPASALSVGTGPGQTTQQEVDDVAAGKLLEAYFTFPDDPTITNAARNSLLDAYATSAAAAMQTRLFDELKWYGATRT